MSKSEYLKKLEKKLVILNEDERAKVIKKYDALISSELKKGKTETEVINELGDVDKLAKEVLKEHKISQEYIERKNNSFEDTISCFVGYIVEGTRDLVAKVEKKDFHNIAIIIIYILIAMFAFWVLRLPFYIVEAIGTGVFNIFSSPVGYVLSFFWSLMINIAYILLVIWVIVIIVRKYNTSIDTYDYKRKNKSNEKKEEKEIIEVKKENTKVVKNAPLEVLFVLLKILIVIMTIPLIFTQIGLFISVGVVIVLLTKGLMLVGPLLILIGIIFIIGTIIDIIFYLTFKKGGN